MVNRDQMERALKYLAETDEEYAKIKQIKMVSECSEKRILAIGFNDAEGTAAARNEAKYLTSEYKAWVDEYGKSVYEFELLKAKRDRAVITIEVWRSLNASMRQGNVT